VKLFIYFFIPFLTILFCSRVDAKNVDIKIECKGKVYQTKNALSWSSEQNIINDKTQVYRIRNFPDSKGKDNWSFENEISIYSNTEGNDPRQPGNPNWYRNVNVTDDLISVIISGGKDFNEGKVSDERMNQKSEYRHTIKINRITGEWTEEDISKTSWKDGSWLSIDGITKGICQKGTQKF
jgi:hypothetical protein